ncbi:uncharacterized protein LOC126482115 [Schistocerca serialis cubense]|uniref:uncharacterized protein LOC126482115 n=1 Tax=Schistocerca serialis cubense TaxID=2023355 RepID=UPI00214E17C5|nr:uncharacterized protein LOC126482115 [Schistocerca serialis cubense]
MTSKLQMKAQMPQFLPEKPELCFVKLELSFDQNEITNEHTRFAVPINALDTKATIKATDIILRPITERQHTFLKKLLIDRMSKPFQQCIQQVLNNEQMGDRTSSEYWRQLHAIIREEDLPDMKLRHIWLAQMDAQCTQGGKR